MGLTSSGAIDQLLATLPAAGVPRQDSTDAQIADVNAFLVSRGCETLIDSDKAVIANRLGMYDAADVFKLRAAKS